MSGFRVVPVGLLALLVACDAAPDAQVAEASAPAVAARPALEGAWRVVRFEVQGGPDAAVVTSPQPSLYIFSGEHYSLTRIDGNEARALWPEGGTRAQLTDAQMRAAFMPYISNAGRWEMRGDTLVTHPVVSLSPNFMGRDFDAFVTALSGDTLRLHATAVTAPVTAVTWTLVREDGA